MTWNRDWAQAAKNIFEALRIKKSDRLAIIYNEEPKGKEFLVKALSALAGKTDTPVITPTVVLDKSFDISSIEPKLYKFFEGTKNTERKFFFSASRFSFRPARGAVHKLISVDPAKLNGFTISLPTSNPDIIHNLALTSPNKLYSRGEALRKILTNATGIRITSPKGTDISFDWDKNKRKYLISAGFPDTNEDHWDNLGGEVYTAPIHETVNGRLIIDGAIGNLGLVDGVVAVDIIKGRATLNRKASTASKKLLDDFNAELTMFPCASVVGEFGIGTTPNLKLVGELVNDEKVEGTIHIAFGDSYSANGSGGENDCDAHTDCMVLSPTVEMTVNGKIITLMKDGKFS